MVAKDVGIWQLASTQFTFEDNHRYIEIHGHIRVCKCITWWVYLHFWVLCSAWPVCCGTPFSTKKMKNRAQPFRVYTWSCLGRSLLHPHECMCQLIGALMTWSFSQSMCCQMVDSQRWEMHGMMCLDKNQQ